MAKLTTAKATLYLAIATILAAVVAASASLYSDKNKNTEGNCSPIVGNIGGNMSINNCEVGKK